MKLQLIAAAVALAFAGVAQAQTTDRAAGERAADRPAAAERKADSNTRTERRAKDAEEDRIEAEYKAAKDRCDKMDGNAKDVCMKEAKGKEKVAKAELDAKKNPSERNHRKVQEAKAEAEYEVAKERCDDLKGNEKDACHKDAKAKHEKAKAAFNKRDNASAGAGRTTDRPEPRAAAK